MSRVLNLLALAFTIAFSAFLLLFVKWHALRSECILKDTCDISEVHTSMLCQFANNELFCLISRLCWCSVPSCLFDLLVPVLVYLTASPYTKEGDASVCRWCLIRTR